MGMALPPPAAPRPRPVRGALARVRGWWPWLRYAVGLGLAGVALWAVLGRRGELSGLTQALTHLRWEWVALALVAEAGSYLAFAAAQRRLLAVTGVTVPVGTMTAIVFVSTAITNSLPGGPVVASVFTFRQFRRRGADDLTAGWALLAVLVAAGASLALVAAVGIMVAGAEGAGSGLVGITAGVVVLTLAGSALLVQRRAGLWLVDRVLRALQHIGGRSTEERRRQLSSLEARLAAVHIDWGQMGAAVLLAAGNWVLDCGCLCLAFLAVGAPVPWHGVLLAYGAGQLAANLPITPGGLGVVEGSMTVAMVAFGGDVVVTATAVLLYRLLSYWLELPLGWAAWGAMAWQQRRDAPAVQAVEPAPVPVLAQVPPGELT